jgi:hypothetical protein
MLPDVMWTSVPMFSAVLAVLLPAFSAVPSLVATQPAIFARRANISVTVAWSTAEERVNISDYAEAGLFVSAFSPVVLEPGDLPLPTKYQPVATASAEALVFEMMNIRAPVEFVLTSGGVPVPGADNRKAAYV